MLKWLNKDIFKIHLLAFVLMVLPAVLLYFAAQRSADFWIWLLLGLVVLGNLLALLA